MRHVDPRVVHRKPELSQHYLRPAAARAIARRLPFDARAVIIEPGAGDGALTQALADAGYHVIAIEKDQRLFDRLSRRMAGRRDVQCVHADILDYTLPRTPYRVVSNVPYSVTAALLRKLLHAARPPDDALLILQREAAEKFAGDPRETLFSLLHKPAFKIEIAGVLRRADFMPPPRVESALLRIHRRDRSLLDAHEQPRYRAFTAATFTHGAPELSRSLRPYLTARQVKRLADDLAFRAHGPSSQLGFDQWLAIFRFVEHSCFGHDPTVIAA